MTSPLGTGSSTIADLLPLAAEQYGDLSATSFKQGEGWQQNSYRELLEDSTAVGLGLLGLGVQHGDRVAILANTRREWSVADFGITRTGAIAVPIYQTNSPAECEWVLSNAGVCVVFVENAEQAAKVAAVRGNVRTCVKWSSWTAVPMARSRSTS